MGRLRARLRGRVRVRRPGALLPGDQRRARQHRRERAGVRPVVDAAPQRDAGDHRARPGPDELRGHRAVPADGRRVRRQGDAAARLRRDRRARRPAHRATRPAAAQPHPGHDHDRQAARLPLGRGRSGSTPTAGSRRSTATLTADGGWSLDLSEPVQARALCHIDNAYWIPNIEAHGRIAKTNKTSQTAFRGFGGPQGMLVIENILGRCAPALGISARELRRRNFYRPGQTTPYGQPVRHPERLERAWTQVERDRRRRPAAGRDRGVQRRRTSTPSGRWRSRR